MERPEEPTWLGIDDLGLVGSMLDAQVEGAREQHKTLLKARPYVLDDHTIHRLGQGVGRHPRRPLALRHPA